MNQFKGKLEEINRIEERRLEYFHHYKQIQFLTHYGKKMVFVESQRKRLDKDNSNVVSKVAQIIYLLDSFNYTMNFLDPLESSMITYHKAFYLLKDETIETEYISDDFEEVYQKIFTESDLI